MTAGDRTTAAEREIRRRVEARGAIPFSEYMAVALYHPAAGYYARDRATTGPDGDFSTSADVSPSFGRRFALQAADVHRALGGGPWRIAELGPGRGLLAGDLLRGLSDLAPESYRALSGVVLVETAEGLRRESVARLRAAHEDLDVRGVSGLDELGDASIRGLVYANELLDALPVSAVVRTRDGLMELHVVVAPDGSLVLEPRPVHDRLVRELAERYGLCPREDHRAEVCPGLEQIAAGVSRVLEKGAALFVDYGHDAPSLADPRHAAGTLVAYRRHSVVLDLLARPGEQDLTAHVNWTHLDDAARASGLDPAGRVTQDRFLLALGLLEDPVFRDAGRETSIETLRHRLAAKRLVLPGEGGGRRFEVAAYVRGIDKDLRGLRPPESWAPPPG